MRHDVKRKEKHRDSVAVIGSSDKIKKRKETTKSVEMMLGVLSRNKSALLSNMITNKPPKLVSIIQCENL